MVTGCGCCLHPKAAFVVLCTCTLLPHHLCRFLAVTFPAAMLWANLMHKCWGLALLLGSAPASCCYCANHPHGPAVSPSACRFAKRLLYTVIGFGYYCAMHLLCAATVPCTWWMLRHCVASGAVVVLCTLAMLRLRDVPSWCFIRCASSRCLERDMPLGRCTSSRCFCVAVQQNDADTVLHVVLKLRCALVVILLPPLCCHC